MIPGDNNHAGQAHSLKPDPSALMDESGLQRTQLPALSKRCLFSLASYTRRVYKGRWYSTRYRLRTRPLSANFREETSTRRISLLRHQHNPIPKFRVKSPRAGPLGLGGFEGRWYAHFGCSPEARRECELYPMSHQPVCPMRGGSLLLATIFLVRHYPIFCVPGSRVALELDSHSA